jgi:hypothetical protein
MQDKTDPLLTDFLRTIRCVIRAGELDSWRDLARTHSTSAAAIADATMSAANARMRCCTY